MSHKEQRDFVEYLKSNFQEHFIDKNVLEIGSLNINGTVRDFFENCNYLGLDLDNGLDVDLVCEGQKYDAPDESFDVVCSLECFEHNPYWFETFQNMIRLCKKNGLVFLTCASEGRAEHGTNEIAPYASPFTLKWNYYKNLNEIDFTSKIDFNNYFSKHEFSNNEQSKDLYFFGIKK